MAGSSCGLKRESTVSPFRHKINRPPILVESSPGSRTPEKDIEKYYGQVVRKSTDANYIQSRGRLDKVV